MTILLWHVFASAMWTAAPATAAPCAIGAELLETARRYDALYWNYVPQRDEGERRQLAILSAQLRDGSRPGAEALAACVRSGDDATRRAGLHIATLQRRDEPVVLEAMEEVFGRSTIGIRVLIALAWEQLGREGVRARSTLLSTLIAADRSSWVAAVAHPVVEQFTPVLAAYVYAQYALGDDCELRALGCGWASQAGPATLQAFRARLANAGDSGATARQECDALYAGGLVCPPPKDLRPKGKAAADR